jgi:PAS domain S-box-containing protein
MGVWHWDIIENKRYFDDHVCHLLGINPATFTGAAEEFIGAVHPDDRETIKAAMARTIEQDVPYEPEYRVVWPDGSTHYITARGRLVRDEKGWPLRINGIIWDITERKQAEEELRRMNTFLDSVVENIPNMIFLKDAGDLRFVRFNRAGEDLLGHSREDLLGKSDYDFFPKEQADFFTEKDREVLRGKELVDIPEEPLQTRNKGERTMHTKKVPILNAKGEPEYLLGISEDITERNLIDEALHKNEARLTEAERIGRFGNWDWDATTDTIIWSEEYYLIHGFDPKQSPPGYEEHLKIYTSDSAKRLDAAVKKSMQTGEPYELDLEQIVADGTSIWTTARSEVKRDANGQIIGLRGTAQDITERKRVEEALHDAETRYRLLFEHSPDGIVIIDPATAKPLEFNESASQHLGYSREEFANLSILDIEVNETPEETRSRIAKVMSDGRADFDTRQHTKQGEIRDIHVTAQITEISGHPVYHCIWRDITQRKQAEQQLQNTLESLRKAFGATIQIMVSAVEARDPYTAGHQIRSADLARAIATEMGLPQKKIEGIRMAGSIHDIGKLSIPAEILSKPTKLSDLEFSLIKEHARKGYEMLKGVESPWPLAEIVYQHHERMDGSGYPRNLKGDDILIEARILAVADVVEAMASHRPYRPGLGIDAALNEIEKNRGTIYDKTVADACLRLFREKGFKLEGT